MVSARATIPTGRLCAHFRRIWAGEPDLRQALFVDMLLVGTMLNILTSGTAMAAYGAGLPGPLALAIFLLALPYNLILCRSVLRAADRVGGLASAGASVTAVLWTAMFLVI